MCCPVTFVICAITKTAIATDLCCSFYAHYAVFKIIFDFKKSCEVYHFIYCKNVQSVPCCMTASLQPSGKGKSKQLFEKKGLGFACSPASVGPDPFADLGSLSW